MVSKYSADLQEGVVTIKLHLGCGAHFLQSKGWTDTDIVPQTSPHVKMMDCSKRFPFADNSVSHVFSEHSIEHMPYQAGLAMLKESFRVLAPNGRVRVSTPDWRFLFRMWTEKDSPAIQEYIAHHRHWSPTVLVDPTPCFAANQYVRAWGHEFIYDFETLADAMGKVGFVDMVQCQAMESKDPELRDIECVERLPPGMMRELSLVVEGRKP